MKWYFAFRYQEIRKFLGSHPNEKQLASQANHIFPWSSGKTVRISNHVLNNLEKLGKGMVGPASNALLINCFFSSSSIAKNSIILFFKIGVLRKSGRFAKTTMMLPAKFSSANGFSSNSMEY